MKKILILPIIVLLTFLLSCGDGVNDPAETEQFKFVDLPLNSTLGDTTFCDTYYTMTGGYTDSIEFNRQFTGGSFGQYGVSATLVVDSGMIANTDTMVCLLSVCVINTSVMVSPMEQNFALPFKLTITYTGLDLQNLDLTDLRFVYSDEKNLVLDVHYDSITIDYANGKLKVVNALLKFDPRQVPDGKYGWVRKAE